MNTWAERISQLQGLGMTYAEIADAVGAAPSTIGDLASERSKSPRGDLAIRLHGLHLARCGTVKQVAAALKTEGEAA